MLRVRPRKQYAHWTEIVQPDVGMNPRFLVFDSTFGELAINRERIFRSVEIACEDGQEVDEVTSLIVIHKAKNIREGVIWVHSIELLYRRMNIVG